jgi:hexosaminidase
MRNLYIIAFSFFCSFLLLSSCDKSDNITHANLKYTLIPKPNEVSIQKGVFKLDQNTSISSVEGNSDLDELLQVFQQSLQKISGIKPLLGYNESSNNIQLALVDDIINPESYSLYINSDKIKVEAKTSNGLFYALQTIRQLAQQKDEQWVIPCAIIKDAPRFPYRGMHLDVSRHFYDVVTIKKMIDQMAYHKLNYFHWHLTDDQGWRIEIKQYPKLTSIGAYRNGTLIGHYNDQPHQFDGKRYGGFYTQEEIKEVVEYAQKRFITTIPEIEMPGHAQAALAAYPELACEEDKYEVWQLWGISENVFCPTEATFQFLENVLDEVMALFPGPYLHIGGDECPKIKWKESTFCQNLMKREGLSDEMELQSYFIQRIEQYVNSKGRDIIGWDEILEGGLAPNATVMSWRGIAGGIEAAKTKHDVIMTPTSHCYFDYYQSDHPDEPLAIGGLLPIEKVYSLEPVPDALTTEESQYILGAQANLWTEYIATPAHLEYMAFPRLCALAEVVWTDKEQKDFGDFISRLSPHLDRLKDMEINPANHLYDVKGIIRVDDGQLKANLSTLAQDATIFYTTDGSTPTSESMEYTQPFDVTEDSYLQAISIRDGSLSGKKWSEKVQLHKAAGKSIQLSVNPHPKYGGEGHSSIINGVTGSNERYGDSEWLGFSGDDVQIIIDLENTTTIDSIQFRFFNGEGQWIYLPSSVACWISEDGDHYNLLGKTTEIRTAGKIAQPAIHVNGKKSGRFIKIKVSNYGVIPDGKQGAGHQSWLFIDEIFVY